MTVATGKAESVSSIVVSGGADGGDFDVIINNGTSDIQTHQYSIAASGVVFLDDLKIYLPAGYVLKVKAAAGISVLVSTAEVANA